MTKIDIISGFLGAGKTTLIKKLIQEAFQGEKLVLIENEFGEIGIDGGFLKESGIQINEMISGCICCSLVGDFNKALKSVMEQYAPDRILIEPSGVGKLSDVMKAVQGVIDSEKDVVINSHIAVADVNRAKVYLRNFGEFYSNQIEFASAVFLSRTQNVEEKKLEETVKLLREHNEKSPIVTTPWDLLTGKQILDAMEGASDFAKDLMEAAQVCPECGHHHDEHEHCHHDHDHDGHEHCHHDHDHDEHKHCHHDHDHDGHEHCHHDHDHDGHEHCHHDHDGHEHCHHDHHHDHHADEVFTSWGKETPKKYTEEGIQAILDQLADENCHEYGIILRAKGIVQEEDGRWIHFDLVPGEDEIRHGAAEYTGRICVIGSQLNEPKLAELFGL